MRVPNLDGSTRVVANPAMELTQDELLAAAKRAHCTVDYIHAAPNADDATTVAHIQAKDGWGAAHFLTELCELDKGRPHLRAAADALRAGAPDNVTFARDVQSFVKGYLRFAPEEGELFIAPKEALSAGVGDCDDHARVVAGLLRAGGVPARIGFLHKPGGQPTHVVAQAKLDDGWHFVETTVDAGFGEEPMAAARRLGIVRSDIDDKIGVLFMGDDTRSKQAILALQTELKKRGLYTGKLDGLYGPLTQRAELASRVGRGDVSEPPPTQPERMGGLGATVSSAHSSDWSDDDCRAFVSTFCQPLGVAIEDAFAVMMNESGGHPGARNGGPRGAAGLFQLMGDNQEAQGFTAGSDAFARLSIREQIPYFYRFFAGKRGKLINVSAMYMATFCPAFIDHASQSSWVIAKAGGRNPSPWGSAAKEAGAYRENPFDADPRTGKRRGYIIVQDLEDFALRSVKKQQARYDELVARCYALSGQTPGFRGNRTLLFALLLVGAGGALHYFRPDLTNAALDTAVGVVDAVVLRPVEYASNLLLG